MKQKNTKKDLDHYRVNFDIFTSEQSLYDKGKVDEALNILKNNNHCYINENALWLKTSEYGDEKDRVLIKSDGNYTYLTPDISYHLDKINRGYEEVIDVLGADHHGYINRLKASMTMLGKDSNIIDVRILQMVRLIKDGAELKLSKRTGKTITLMDLVEEIGVNATRYFFASHSLDASMDFNIDLALKQSNENPVYYIQYAHARCCSIMESYGKLEVSDDTSGSLLTNPKEVDLLKHIGAFEKVVLDAALNKAPFKITNYLYTLASLFHTFYNECKVIDKENLELTAQRVVLAKMTRITIKNGLKLIGVEALNKM